MKLRISKGGQISLPALIRRRWGTDSIFLEDMGDRIVLRPIPADPIAAAIGAFPSPVTSADARAQIRLEEQEADDRRYSS